MGAYEPEAVGGAASLSWAVLPRSRPPGRDDESAELGGKQSFTETAPNGEDAPIAVNVEITQ
jgi:hypothetical protein